MQTSIPSEPVLKSDRVWTVSGYMSEEDGRWYQYPARPIDKPVFLDSVEVFVKFKHENAPPTPEATRFLFSANFENVLPELNRRILESAVSLHLDEQTPIKESVLVWADFYLSSDGRILPSLLETMSDTALLTDQSPDTPQINLGSAADAAGAIKMRFLQKFLIPSGHQRLLFARKARPIRPVRSADLRSDRWPHGTR